MNVFFKHNSHSERLHCNVNHYASFPTVDISLEYCLLDVILFGNGHLTGLNFVIFFPNFVSILYVFRT